LELAATGSSVLTNGELRLQKAVNPLVFQQLGTGFSTVMTTTIPSADRIYNLPDVGANADFMFTQGAQTKTGVLTFTDQIIGQSSIVVRSNTGGANGHIITSGSAPAAAYNHFLQSKTETIAGRDDIIYYTKSAEYATPYGAAAFTFAQMDYIAGFGFSLIQISANIDIGTTGTLTLVDTLNSGTVATIVAVGTGTLAIYTTSSFSNIPLASSSFEWNWSRTAGASTCDLYSIIVKADS
jgi:hypothetical protein